MGQVRWFDRAGPPSLMFATALMLAVALPSAIRAVPSDRGSNADACNAPDFGAIARAAARSYPAAREVATRTVLDPVGVVTGRRLELPTGANGRAINLAPESFVAPVMGSVVLYGEHTVREGSVVRALDVETGCDLLLARPDHVVRSAILDPAGTALYVHAVTPGARADAGVVRHDLATGAKARVVEPLPEDDRFGPTFATELRWSIDATALAVQSCGFSRCRTRVLDVASGSVETYAGAGHGSVIGVTPTHIVVLDACHWSPCGVLAIERATGGVTTLAEEAFSAELEQREGRAIVVLGTADGSREVTP